MRTDVDDWTDPVLQAEDERYSWLHANGYGEGPTGRLVEYAPWLLECERILDAGCGRQGFAQRLRAAGYQGEIVGLDVSRHVVENALDACEVLHASLDDIPFEDAHFDGLFCCDVLEHLPPDRVQAVLGELGRVLAPGGAWALSVGTEPSRCRGPQGEDLHQTVRPLAWWAEEIAETPLARPLASEQVTRGALLRGLRGGGVLEFATWVRARGWDQDPWLMLGKGPSFARYGEVDTQGYRVLGLNHSVREARVDLAHAIDLDVVTDLGEDLLEQADCLVLPWHPHVAFEAGEKTVEDLLTEVPVLGTLAEEGRLLTYDLGTWPGPHRRARPQVGGGFFSGDVVVQLLAYTGVKTIRTLGIDGGRDYAQAFEDLTPLENGHQTFAAQTRQIAGLVQAFALDYGPVLETPQTKPRVTVVLVTRDDREHVTGLLDALEAYTRTPHELLVVDNASSDGTREHLRSLRGRPGFRLIENAENRRCAAATNQALAACRTEYVLYLCASHALVTEPGWDEPLVAFLDEHTEFDVAGDVWNPGFPLASSRYAPGWTPEGHGAERLLHVQGGAWIARRALFDEVGFFAEDEHPHGGMDVELSYRLLSLGRSLGRCPAVCCPSHPQVPRRAPGVTVYHPAPEQLRAEVRRELARARACEGSQPTASRPAAIVFCERIDNESFCAAIVRELSSHYEVRPCGPGWPIEDLLDVDARGARFYLELDAASGNFVRPYGLELLALPKFAWLIDTHKKPTFHQSVAADMDLTFHAMQTWGHVLPGRRAWLPLHADQEVFFPRQAERDLDVVFVGSHVWRAGPLGRIAERHGLGIHVTTTTGPLEKTQTAELYARARLVFNRHVTNDLNFRVFEATASGRVLLTDAQYNGQYDLFEDGRHCVLYTDEQDLERKVLRLLGDEQARARIEREAAAHAARHHTTRARVEELHRAIEGFLAESTPRRHSASARTGTARATGVGAGTPHSRPPARPRRWLVLAGAEAPTVSLQSYGEHLAGQLASGGDDVTLVLERRRRLPSSPARDGDPARVELDLGPLPRPASTTNRLLARAAAFQGRLFGIVSERGPFDAVLAEGALGALLGTALAARLELPLTLALERCEVARRDNQLTREQLYVAELEHYGVAHAATVWTPTHAVATAVRRHYQLAEVEVRPPQIDALVPPASPERLLAALGLTGPPALLLLSPPLAEAERARVLTEPSAPPSPGVLLAACDDEQGGLWLGRADGEVVRLSDRPVRGPALAALLVSAQRVVALRHGDHRALEATALGVPVSTWREAHVPTLAELLELASFAKEEVLCVARR